MKAQQPIPRMILLLLAASLILLPACSSVEPPQPATPAVPRDAQPVAPDQNDEPAMANALPPAVMTSAGASAAPVQDGMLAFEGTIFVATTELVGELWQAAGWKIGESPIRADPADLPADCTLYPHDGVENQWVGRCRGYILVPQAGARDIAVMITDGAGSTTMVQVAPPPGDPTP